MGVRRFVALAPLVFAGGCVALTGLGDLSVENDPPEAGSVVHLPDGAVGVVTDDGAIAPISDAATGTPDAGAGDSAAPRDSGIPDTGVPDTGPPVDGGSTVGVRCNTKVCSGATAICCYYGIAAEFGSCAAKPSACTSSSGFACDGDEDCPAGAVCCVSWQTVTFMGSSSCQATCTAGAGFSGAGLACANNPDRCGATNQACKVAPEAPPNIYACQ